MSMGAVQEIIRKAVLDEAFRTELIGNPEETVTELDLSTDETDGLLKLTDEAFVYEAGTL